MPHARWTLSAETDLDNIVFYIAIKDRRRRTARNIYHEIRDKCKQYALQPTMGQAYPELGNKYRGFVHKRWLIIFQPREYGIEVYAVLDSSRDFVHYFRSKFPP